MKTIVIGDIHGRDTWKKILEQKHDRVIFLGDYLDPYDNISDKVVVNNFNDIIAYAECDERVTLLLGNHDYHYCRFVKEHYSRFNGDIQYHVMENIEDGVHSRLIKTCVADGKFLFTHAGVTNTWLNSVDYGDDVPIDEFINDLMIYSPDKFRFTPGVNMSGYGDDITQSPIWVRPNSLFDDYYQGYVHVVGHTQMWDINITPIIIMCDSLAFGNYLVIEDGKVRSGSVK